jgi:hypothetical protein
MHRRLKCEVIFARALSINFVFKPKIHLRIYKGLDSSFDDMAYRPLAFFAEKAPVSSFCMT